MYREIHTVDIPDHVEEFDGIKYLRSILYQFSFRPTARAWKDEDMIALSEKGFGFLDCSPGYEYLEDLLQQFPDICYLVVRDDGKNDNWKAVLQTRWSTVTIEERWAFSSDELVIETVQSAQSDLPDGYELRQLTRDDYHLLDKEMSGTAQFIYGTTDRFFAKAPSFGIIDTGENTLVSLCAGYPLLTGQDEIDVRTRDNPKYRRKGFGSIAARALMIHSLQNDRVPVWDAANKASKKMALKLGFSDPESYFAYICKH